MAGQCYVKRSFFHSNSSNERLLAQWMKISVYFTLLLLLPMLLWKIIVLKALILLSCYPFRFIFTLQEVCMVNLSLHSFLDSGRVHSSQYTLYTKWIWLHYLETHLQLKKFIGCHKMKKNHSYHCITWSLYTSKLC